MVAVSVLAGGVIAVAQSMGKPQAMPEHRAMKMDEAAVKSMINSWPKPPKMAPMEAWQKYGAPAEATENMLMVA